MEELVLVMNNKAVCTSLHVAEKFEKRHSNVMRDIRGLLKNERTKQMFEISSYTEKQNGQEYPMCYMNRDGFTLLAMGFTGEKALDWKIKYINAFNAMEEMLKERNSQSWISAREQGKITRNEETGVLKMLVEYAKGQDYSHEDRFLYMNYTKLADKICGISKRDNATAEQLTNLTVVENIILHCVQDGIKQDKYYKDIYKDCKKRLDMFKDIAYLE